MASRRSGADMRPTDAVELDRAATARLVRALEAGVPMCALERRCGRGAKELRRAALAAGWDGGRAPEPLVAPVCLASVALPPGYYGCSRRP